MKRIGQDGPDPEVQAGRRFEMVRRAMAVLGQ